MKRTFVPILSLAIVLGAGIGLAAADGIGHRATPCVREHVSSPEDYKVFVDEPTGYTFVCTPAGWKFVSAGIVACASRRPDSVRNGRRW